MSNLFTKTLRAKKVPMLQTDKMFSSETSMHFYQTTGPYFRM